MADTTAFLRLMSWMSPVFPTGGFAYSSGLEAAVFTGVVASEEQLAEWLSSLLHNGSPRNDALFLTAATRNHDDPVVLLETAELALALAGSSERHLEMLAQGTAFIDAVRSWPQTAETFFPQLCPLSVAIGISAGQSNLDPSDTLNAYLHGFISNQVQAAIRLSIIGQSAAARILARLEPTICSIADKAMGGTFDDLGTATVVADVMVMKHEELEGRLFRS